MTTRTIAIAALLLTALAGAGPALAQGTAEQRAGCEPDAFKFCNQYIPMVAQIEACLTQHMKHLSPACRVQMGGSATSTSSKRKLIRKRKVSE